MILALWLACASQAPPTSGPASPAGWSEAERALILSLSPLPPLPPSPGNPVADDPRAVQLGRAIFLDAGFSADGAVACATCHRPERYFTDGLPLAKGLGLGGRNAPTVVGSQWGAWFFWDGRADSLWAQALGPLESPVEHGFDRVRAARRVAERYTAEYEALFGPLPDLDPAAGFPAFGRPNPGDPAGPDHSAWTAMGEAQQQAVRTVFANLGRAVEAYERTLLPQESPFDRYAAALAQGDPGGGGALTPSQARGLELFVGDAGCINCHNGPLFADDAFHNLGLPQVANGGLDMGRAVGARRLLASEFNCASPTSGAADCPELRYLNPEFPDFIMAFKTPTLRNVAETGPYMHDGRFATLAEVLAFYQELPGEPTLGHRELTLQPLRLPPEDLQALEDFLRSLTGPPPAP